MCFNLEHMANGSKDGVKAKEKSALCVLIPVSSILAENALLWFLFSD